MLREHMPELVPTYERLFELAGGGDVAARMLSLWTAAVVTCRAARRASGRAASPCSCATTTTRPRGSRARSCRPAGTGRRVIGMSDCLWGLLDGVNDAGLAVSLAFGGRPVRRRRLRRPAGRALPARDLRDGRRGARGLARAAASPRAHAHAGRPHGRVADRLPRARPRAGLPPAAGATNHQGDVEWTEHAARHALARARAPAADAARRPRTTPQSFATRSSSRRSTRRTTPRASARSTRRSTGRARGAAEYRWPGHLVAALVRRFRGRRTVRPVETKTTAA